MNRLITIIPLVILLCLTLGYHKSTDLTKEQKELIVKEVKELSHQLWVTNNQRYKENSTQSIVDFFDETCDQIWQTEPVAWIGNTALKKTRNDMKNYIQSMIERRISTDMVILDEYFAVLSENNVLEVKQCEYTITMKDGQVKGPYCNAVTAVWCKKNDQWKMVHVHESYVKKEKD